MPVGTTGGRSIVIVGASLAGLRTAEALRSLGYEEKITLVGDEPHPPYDRPPLSKQLLSGARTEQDIVLRPQASVDDLSVDLRIGRRAEAVVAGRHVVLDTGEQVAFTELVIATGLSARRLPGQPDTDVVHVLRTLEDARRLREALRTAGSLLVVGGGFVGAEVAAVARAKGISVTMLERMPEPFAEALGTPVATRCADLHRQHGVRVVTNAHVSQLHASDQSATVRLRDGRIFEADCALVGVGTTPNSAWLRAPELTAPGGIPCDAAGRVQGRPHFFAAGDVAAWRSHTYGDRRRVEHWTNAVEQAQLVARTVLGLPPKASQPHDVPYFWSDQYQTKVQLVGRPDLADRVELTDLPDLPERPARLLGTYFRGTRLVAAVTFGAPSALARLRPLATVLADEEKVRSTTAELIGAPA